MASVERRKDGRPGYITRWRDEAGQQRKKSFTRKADADRFRAEVEHKLNTGSYVDPRAGKRTFEAYAEQWRATQLHRPNTVARTRSQFNRHVYPVLGRRPIAAIRASEVQAFATGLSSTLAPTTVRTVFSCVRAVFAAALHDRAIGHDPCARIKLPERPQTEIVPLTVDQVDALAAAIDPRYRALVVVGAGAGLRQGELFGLQVADVDFLRKTMTLDRQIQPKAGGGTLVGPLKNRASYRTIPLGQVVVDALAAHLAAYPATGTAYVFRTPAGEALYRSVFNADVWSRARVAAGVPEATCHDLRHFFASALIRAGLNPKVVAARLGHSDPSMTLRVYTHLWPDDEDRSRQAIDDVFRRDVPHLRPVKEA